MIGRAVREVRVHNGRSVAFNDSYDLVKYIRATSINISRQVNSAIVFNRYDGCVWGRFAHDDYPASNNSTLAARNQVIRANHDAYKLCMELNGNPVPDIAGIDSTP